ncbi:hypothetical protein GFY24_34255 [Nocardia sp. SYP-A9097]|uniref:hypothetical protein n=1 Tax=Nocardia sp. SYP-A9097 TaxID=2663237 RepID=UPI00129B23BD|nr:hypothetical protein [Nocardia sp. SYP-A9097]MRH92429.1 hypothetical protein [Nocardia sp. SYP-A9097]
MLGDQVGEVTGQAISTRVLGDIGLGPRTEITHHQVGTLCGVQIDSTVTYVGTMRPNGTLAGEGTGFVVTASGQTATFRGTGVGRFTGPGTVSWRGAVFYETSGEELSRLNGIALAFEYTVHDGKSEGKQFEWK